MRKRITLLAIGLAILLPGMLLPGVSAAADKKPKKSAEDRFKKADKDGNGQLSLEEFIGKRTEEKKKEMATKRFKKLDANSDSALSLDEFKAGDKPKKA